MASTESQTAVATALPDTLPIFPLSGVVLLPRARLPLNIFEPRYLSLVEDALGRGRLIGMLQPLSGEDHHPHPPLYQVGCAGRITSFSETDDGRFLINLVGVCRFRVGTELQQNQNLYRSIQPDWSAYTSDIGPEEDVDLDRARLMSVLKQYFKNHNIAADWSAVQNTTNEMLISSLAMICPLEPNEKQALLEADGLKARAAMLTALLEMATMPQAEADGARH